MLSSHSHDFQNFQRKFPSPGFQVEVVLVDWDTTTPTVPAVQNLATLAGSIQKNTYCSEAVDESDELFSDDDVNESSSPKLKQLQKALTLPCTTSKYGRTSIHTQSHQTEEALHLRTCSTPKATQRYTTNYDNADLADTSCISEFRAMAADASVFTFGCEEDSETDD